MTTFVVLTAANFNFSTNSVELHVDVAENIYSLRADNIAAVTKQISAILVLLSHVLLVLDPEQEII